MKNIQLHVPDSLDMDENEILMLLAAKLYEQGNLSLGQAAELAGKSKREFAEQLGRYNVSLFNFPVSELSRDVSNA